MAWLADIAVSVWNSLTVMAPYLLFGFAVAGALSVVVSRETVEKHLGGRGMAPVVKAAAFGVPLPLCSCGVIPVAMALRKHGSSRGATVAFLPTFIFFLAGWSSTNLFSTIGGARVLTMLFGYEVPLFLAVLSPAVLANSWRLAEIAAFYRQRPALALINLLGFVIALICVQAKLERTPFDIPHAETEIVGGTFTEYSGKKLAIFRLMIDAEMVVAAGLLATVFLGGFPGGAFLGLINFIIKTLIVIFFLSLLRATTSRIRVDQVVSFAWKYMAPLAILQLLIVILVKGLIS